MEVVHLSHQTIRKKEKLITNLKAGRALVHTALIDAIEWLIALDWMLNAIIAAYFVGDDGKRSLFEEEVLARDFFTTYNKIQVFKSLETTSGSKYGARYKRLVNTLEKINANRNTLVHSAVVVSPDSRVSLWKSSRGSGKLAPHRVTRASVQQIDSGSEKSLDQLSRIYARLLKRQGRNERSTMPRRYR